MPGLFRPSLREPGRSLAELLSFWNAAVLAQADVHVLVGGLDFHGTDAVRAVEEVAPGGHDAVDIVLAQADAAEVDEDDGAGAAAVEAVDVEGEAEEDQPVSWAQRPGE
ncbi:hypothetical protein ABZZ04_10140 [Streptomyces sp. NPDC006435]|uniref:hypothetical protein n=1 Tax=Streptomyces sp. NPDC006435 TaxID=3154300 RepID=UPI0033ADD060